MDTATRDAGGTGDRAPRGPARYAGAVALGLILCIYAALFPAPGIERAGGDGFYTWIFARSLAFDADLDLANDYEVCGDPWKKGADEGGGHPANPFYLGPALLWAPVLAIVKSVVPLPADASAAWHQGCGGLWATITLAMTPVVAALAALVGFLLARRWCGPFVSAAAMVVVALGSPLMHWGALVVQYSHAYSALGVALAVLAWVRAVETQGSLRRWYLAGLAIGFASLMRSQTMVLLLAPAITLGMDLVLDLRTKRRPWQTLEAGGLVLAGFASLAWIQVAANLYLYGRPWVIPQGATYLQLGHAHPLLTLFAARNGMLYWHPLLWLGVIGAGIMVVRRSTRRLGITLGIPLAIDVYINSAVLDWHGAASFGARRLVPLAAPLVVTTALFLSVLWRWLSASRLRLGVFAAAGWLLPWVVIGMGMCIGDIRGDIPYSKAVPMPELYSTGLRKALEEAHRVGGNPAAWPATLPFALRYGVAPRRFDSLSGGGMFAHTYRPVKREGPDTIDFKAREVDNLLVEGMDRQPEGVRIQAGSTGRMLVELAWPFVTHIAVTARSAEPDLAVVRVRSGSFFGRGYVGTLAFPPGGGTFEIEVPADSFDSGVNEILFDVDRDVVLESWTWIDRGQHDTSL